MYIQKHIQHNKKKRANPNFFQFFVLHPFSLTSALGRGSVPTSPFLSPFFGEAGQAGGCRQRREQQRNGSGAGYEQTSLVGSVVMGVRVRCDGGSR
jgi:hypothetical protein